MSTPAVDHLFSAGYDVWAKAITSLADIGYDPNSMVALPYDWRLSIPNLEKRDAYYTRLRSQARFITCVESTLLQGQAVVEGSSLTDSIKTCSKHSHACAAALQAPVTECILSDMMNTWTEYGIACADRTVLYCVR